MTKKTKAELKTDLRYWKTLSIILLIGIVLLIIILVKAPLFQTGEGKSTNQEDWVDCRSMVWETCGMTEHVDVLNYILDLSIYGGLNNTEMDFLYEFVFKTSTDCWEEFAQSVCDDNFNMNKIETAKIEVKVG